MFFSDLKKYVDFPPSVNNASTKRIPAKLYVSAVVLLLPCLFWFPAVCHSAAEGIDSHQHATHVIHTRTCIFIHWPLVIRTYPSYPSFGREVIFCRVAGKSARIYNTDLLLGRFVNPFGRYRKWDGSNYVTKHFFKFVLVFEYLMEIVRRKKLYQKSKERGTHRLGG